MESLHVIDWSEYVNPDKIVINVSNGRELIIKNSNRKSYQMWLRMLDNYDSNEKVRNIVNSTIPKM